MQTRTALPMASVMRATDCAIRRGECGRAFTRGLGRPSLVTRSTAPRTRGADPQLSAQIRYPRPEAAAGQQAMQR
jgi:hypothetical protein